MWSSMGTHREPYCHASTSLRAPGVLSLTKRTGEQFQAEAEAREEVAYCHERKANRPLKCGWAAMVCSLNRPRRQSSEMDKKSQERPGCRGRHDTKVLMVCVRCHPCKNMNCFPTHASVFHGCFWSSLTMNCF